MGLFYGRLRRRRTLERENSTQTFSRRGSHAEFLEKTTMINRESFLLRLSIFACAFSKCILGRLYHAINGRKERKERKRYASGRDEYILEVALMNFSGYIRYLADEHSILLEMALWSPLVVTALYIVLIEGGELVCYPDNQVQP